MCKRRQMRGSFIPDGGSQDLMIKRMGKIRKKKELGTWYMVTTPLTESGNLRDTLGFWRKMMRS